jgi:RNA polymerase sigma-70 factor (ECF subfamily)
MRPRQRDALLLYALADLSYKEIALVLDVPVGTVRTWLHRAREVAQRDLAADVGPFSFADRS